MKRKLVWSLVSVVLGSAAVVPSALAAEGVSFSVGLRAWGNQWSTWDVYPGASENFTSGTRVAVLPTVGVRFGSFLASASHFARKSYDFQGNTGNFSAKRQETDILGGYYVLPTLALTLGHKTVKQDFGGTAQFKYSGPIFGMVASAPLTSGFSLYGTIGLGRMKASLPLQDAGGSSRLDADYFLGEVGVAYSLNPGSLVPGAKAMALTAGYRNQVLATKGFKVPLSTTNSSLYRSTDLRDTTEGFTLGFTLSF